MASVYSIACRRKTRRSVSSKLCQTPSELAIHGVAEPAGLLFIAGMRPMAGVLDANCPALLLARMESAATNAENVVVPNAALPR